MTTVEETRINGLLNELRDAETEWRRAYARVLQVVAALDQEKPVTGFRTTAQMFAAVLNISRERPAPARNKPSC